jgi:hypothetical protein
MAKRKGKGAADEAAPKPAKKVKVKETLPAIEAEKVEQVAPVQDAVVEPTQPEAAQADTVAETPAPARAEVADPVKEVALAAAEPEPAKPAFPARYVVRNNSPSTKAFPVIDTIIEPRKAVTVTINTESKYRRLMTDVKQLTELAGNPHLITVKPAIED